jgi:GH24 family phage-related lysozyme (muramidase)
MKNKTLLNKYITNNEGILNHVYFDSLGIRTIGIGFNLNRNDARSCIESLGITFNQLLRNEIRLSSEQIQILFERDLDSSIKIAERLFKDFSEISFARQIILVDLVFNLGETRLSKFQKMINAVNRRDWIRAAFELEDSLWFRQVGNRGPRNVNGLKMDVLIN